MTFDTKLSRRTLLQSAVASGLATLLPGSRARAAAAQMQAVPPRDRKLLFVLGAWGGASIIDSFMAVAEGEVGDLLLAQSLNVFPDGQLVKPAQTNFRVPRLLSDYGIFATPTYSLETFAQKHGADIAVIAHEVSSVNHAVGQQRALNGASANRGRTLMEAMALRYGGGLVLPNCNMASDGYVRNGLDPDVPAEARHELIAAPLMFATGTHGYRGVAGAPPALAIERARAARAALEQRSIFGRTFADDARRQKFLYSRDRLAPHIESAALFDKLLLADAQTMDPKYGVSVDPLASKLRELLPELETDRAEAQLALAFLLAYHGISVSVTIGYSQDAYVTPAGNIVGSPIAFDFSHNSHRQAQSLMWCRTARLLDTLITLLKSHDYLGDPSLGKMWDRSLIYVATEFGRDKKRPFLSGSWGTGHDLNNGSLIISPLVRGNAVYGGVNPKTCLTHGFDRDTGKPQPGTVMNEGDVYGIIAQALDLDSPTTKRFPAVVRA